MVIHPKKSTPKVLFSAFQEFCSGQTQQNSCNNNTKLSFRTRFGFLKKRRHSEALAEESPTNKHDGYFASAQYDERKV